MIKHTEKIVLFHFGCTFEKARLEMSPYVISSILLSFGVVQTTVTYAFPFRNYFPPNTTQQDVTHDIAKSLQASAYSGGKQFCAILTKENIHGKLRSLENQFLAERPNRTCQGLQERHKLCQLTPDINACSGCGMEYGHTKAKIADWYTYVIRKTIMLQQQLSTWVTSTCQCSCITTQQRKAFATILHELEHIANSQYATAYDCLIGWIKNLSQYGDEMGPEGKPWYSFFRSHPDSPIMSLVRQKTVPPMESLASHCHNESCLSYHPHLPKRCVFPIYEDKIVYRSGLPLRDSTVV